MKIPVSVYEEIKGNLTLAELAMAVGVNTIHNEGGKVYLVTVV